MSVQYETWPMIRFGVIRTAWDLYKRRAMTWSLAVVIMMCVYAVASGLLHSAFGGGKPFHPGGFRLFNPASGALSFLISTVVGGVLTGGMIRMASNQIHGRVPRIEDLFSVAKDWFDLVLVSLLIGLAVTLGHMLFVIPGFIVSGLLMFAIPLVVEGQMPATGAIIQSWHTLKDQWLTATIFHLVLILLTASGVLLCGIGVLFTGPLYSLAIALLYHGFYPVAPAGPWKKKGEPFPEI